MIKVKTIGMIEKNAKNNPVVKAHQDLKNGALHIVTNGITEFPTPGTSETKQTKNICIALNTGSGDEKYTDLTIKKGDFVNSYLLDAWENQEIILDESHITYEQSQDYSKISPNETKLVSGTDGNFKIETDISNYGIYFIVTEKLQFNGNAVSVKIVRN